MTEQQQLPDIRGILRRRKKGFIFFFVLVFAVALVTAFVLPPVYISKTTILVEGQQIPSEYVRTTVTSYVEERLQIITQQVMSRTKLMEIINQLKLYPDMRKRYTWGEIIAKMRNDINLKTISAERGGKGGSSATIAFSLSYEGRNPSTVQKVANILASLYLEENVRSREKRAATTTEYLETELQHSKDEVNSMEQRISKFKMVHMGELPGHNQTNIQTLERLSGSLEQIAVRMRSLEERKVILQGQLTYVRSQVPEPGTEGAASSGPGARLRYLRVQLAALQSKYSDKHPDVKSLKNEIKELESQLSAASDIAGLEKHLEEVKAELAGLKAKYGEKHPDVVSKTKELQALAEEVRARKARESNELLAAGSADSPA
ncbi:MAG: Wzz/FepE/Etk N-terminal domain-containing protein, partial [Thermodesulfobacteriota bacterium]|nr:Wzz/FepE/Etk N-terminal domain-containing protein [Thermodesulfobacteriota bacterium]